MRRVNVERKGLLFFAAMAMALASPVNGQGSSAPDAASERDARAGVPDALQRGLQKLHASNQAEIRVARMAQGRALSASVLRLAALIEQEDQRIDDQLRGMAQRLGVDLEGGAYDEEYDRLTNEASEQLASHMGQAFDRAYADLTVRRQQQEVNENLKDWLEDARQAGKPQLVDELQRVRKLLESRLALSRQVQDIEHRQSRVGSSPDAER